MSRLSGPMEKKEEVASQTPSTGLRHLSLEVGAESDARSAVVRKSF